MWYRAGKQVLSNQTWPEEEDLKMTWKDLKKRALKMTWKDMKKTLKDLVEKQTSERPKSWKHRFSEWVLVDEQFFRSQDSGLTGQQATGGKMITDYSTFVISPNVECIEIKYQFPEFLDKKIKSCSSTIKFHQYIDKNLPGALPNHTCRDWSLSLRGARRSFILLTNI